MERKDLTYTDAIKICFSKFADFSGRARRQEYWYFVVFNMLIQAALNALGRLVFGSDSNMASIFAGIYALVVLVPSLAVTWRRLHDVARLSDGSSFSSSSAKTASPVRTSTA